MIYFDLIDDFSIINFVMWRERRRQREKKKTLCHLAFSVAFCDYRRRINLWMQGNVGLPVGSKRERMGTKREGMKSQHA